MTYIFFDLFYKSMTIFVDVLASNLLKKHTLIIKERTFGIVERQKLHSILIKSF